MLLHNPYGVDLGTDAVKVYCLGSDRTLCEKNMIAIRNGKQVLAVGDAAYEMYGKAPSNVRVDRPVQKGRIADIAKVEYVLRTMIRRAAAHSGYAPALYFSTPVNMSEIERQTYYAISHAGYLHNPKVYLVDRAICDSIAMGIPLSKTKGTVIVNIGGENTEISVIANGQVMISKDIPIGGSTLNSAISDRVLRKKNLIIGEKTAAVLKTSLTDLGYPHEDTRKIIGISTLSGLPKETLIEGELVNRAVEEVLRTLAQEVRTFLERTPPQIRKEAASEGIYMTGGTARIPFLEPFMTKRIGCSVMVSTYYERCTISGLKEIITHKPLHKWAHAVGKRK